MTIAEQIRDIRKYKGMTLRELAEAAGSSAKTISRIENGQQDMTVTLANKLLGAMGCKLSIVSSEQREATPLKQKLPSRS